MSAVVSVTVSRLARYRFPNFCAICVRPGPSEALSVTSDEGKFSGYYVAFTTWKHLITSVPVCRDCKEKERRLQKLTRFAILAGIVLAAAIAIKFDLSRGWAILLGVVFVAPGVLASEYIGKPVRVGQYDDELVEFKFKSPEYANMFELANSPQS
jgi:hypothetical protein